jgi:hypothetical protein
VDDWTFDVTNSLADAPDIVDITAPLNCYQIGSGPADVYCYYIGEDYTDNLTDRLLPFRVCWNCTLP